MINRSFTYRSSIFTIITCSFFLLFCIGSVKAGLPLGISGNLDISYGESEINKNTQELLNQKYSFNWQKSFLSQLTLRTSYRYSKSDLTQNSSNPIWNEEQQPSLDLVWNNSNFTFSTSNTHRITDATLKNLKLYRKSWSSYFKTKSIKYPILSIRFNRDHIFNHSDLSLQNLNENRFQTELNHSYKSSILRYGFARRFNENQINNLRSTQYTHTFNLTNVKRLYENKVIVSSNYSFSYQTQTDERPSDTTDYFVIQILSGLYRTTSNYTFDSLTEIHGLSDGNFRDPIQPLIDVGGISINQNLGVDFGFNQEVGALYLYVDQYSDKLSWYVYVSSDNLNWDLHTIMPDVIFNEGYNRFEIKFQEVMTRYIKVVNIEVSDIEHAYVTEIQAMEERSVSKFSKTNSSAHIFDINSSYRYSDKTSYGFSGSYQHLPGQFDRSNRDNVSYSLSTRYKHSDLINHNFRLNHDMQFFNGSALDLSSYGLSYLIHINPLERLEFTVSSSLQEDYIDGEKNTNNRSLLLNSKGSPLNNLNMSIDFTFSHNIQYLSKKKFNSWNGQISMDGVLNRSITLTINYSHRYVESVDTEFPNGLTKEITRDQVQVGMRYRLTRTIFIRGSINLNYAERSFFTQDYMINWKPSNKLSLSSQMKLQNNDDVTITKRYNTQLNYKISRNANLYVSYFINDLTEAAGERNQSVRVGFRSGL